MVDSPSGRFRGEVFREGRSSRAEEGEPTISCGNLANRFAICWRRSVAIHIEISRRNAGAGRSFEYLASGRLADDKNSCRHQDSGGRCMFFKTLPCRLEISCIVIFLLIEFTDSNLAGPFTVFYAALSCPLNPRLEPNCQKYLPWSTAFDTRGPTTRGPLLQRLPASQCHPGLDEVSRVSLPYTRSSG